MSDTPLDPTASDSPVLSAQGRSSTASRTGEVVAGWLLVVTGAILASTVASALEWGLYASRTGVEGFLSIVAIQAPLVLLVSLLVGAPAWALSVWADRRFHLLFPSNMALRRLRLFWALLLTLCLLAFVPYPAFRLVQELARTVTSAAITRAFVSFASTLVVGGAVVFCALAAFAAVWLVPQRWLQRLRPSLLWVWTLGFPVPFLVLPCWAMVRAPVALTPATRLLIPALVVALLPLACQLPRLLPRLGRLLLAALLGSGVVALALVWALSGQFRQMAVVRAPFTSLCYTPLRSMVDLDGDGYIQIWEGRDCDESSPERHAQALDIPGNDVDENCDGEDESDSLPPLELSPPQPRPYDDSRPFNVVVILLDALRADHVHAYGYPRDTTPNLDTLAEQGLLFAKAQSQYPSTGMSVPSILAGSYPSVMRWQPPGKRSDYPLAPGTTLLPDLLRDNGYYTGAVVSNWLPSHIIGLAEHFDRVLTLGDSDEWKRIAFSSSPISTAKAMEFLQTRPKNRPFFLFLHYADAHAPYVNHPSPGRSFGVRTLDRYDSDIFWADLWMGLFLHYLDHVDLWDDTIVVVLADHGEEFGEHGMKNHGHQLHAESVNVPLVLRVPGIETGQTIEEPVALLDLAPTLLDLVGIEGARGNMHGQSLLGPALDFLSTPRRPIFSVMADREMGPTRRGFAVRMGSFKLILDLEEGTSRLYNVDSDPAERFDLSADDAERAGQLRDLIDQFSALSHPSFLEF